MEPSRASIPVNGQTANLHFLKISDRAKFARQLIEGFDIWRRQSQHNKATFGRRSPIREDLTEGLYCLITGAVRKRRWSGIKGDDGTFDCIHLDTLMKVQVKGASINPDLSSFGNKAGWDRLVFVDASDDEQITVYDIPPVLDEVMVTKKETFAEKMAAKMRPKLSLQRTFVQTGLAIVIWRGSIKDIAKLVMVDDPEDAAILERISALGLQ